MSSKSKPHSVGALADLKKLLPAKPAGSSAPKRKAKAAKPAAVDDPIRLFRAAVADVTPLPPPNRADLRATLAPLSTCPWQTWADEAAALQESQTVFSDWSLWLDAVDFEADQSFLRPGVASDVLRRLKRGYWSIQGTIDLHAHTVAEARDALAGFLAMALRDGRRCVRVIHGKGLSSPLKQPILKGKVRRWLQLKDEVLAYCEAPPRDGGSGVLIVLLRGS